MKKYFGILLFLSLFAPYFISYLWLLSNKQSVKDGVRSELTKGANRNNLVRLVFSHKEAAEMLRWEKSDEFEYRGQMFDIVEIQTHGDKVTYLCYWDKKETSINSRIKTVLAKALGHAPPTQDNQKRIQNFFQSLFLQDHFKWHPLVPECQDDAVSFRKSECLTTFIEPLIPPPRIS